MVATPEDLADFFEGEVGKVSAEIHGDLSGNGNFAGAAWSGEVGDLEVEALGDEVLDFAGAEGVLFLLLFLEDVAEDLFGQWEVDRFLPFQFLEVSEAIEGTFEAADIGLDGFGEEFEDIRPDVKLELGSLGFQDFDPCSIIGATDGWGEAGLEFGGQGGAGLGELVGGAVASQEDLFTVVVEVVGQAVELFLRGGIHGQDLHVVQEEDIGGTVLAAEAVIGALFVGLGEFCDELFGRAVQNVEVGVEPVGFLGVGVEEVGLAEARPAVDADGVGHGSWLLCRGLAGEMGRLVTRAGDEGFESEGRVKLAEGLLYGGEAGRICAVGGFLCLYPDIFPGDVFHCHQHGSVGKPLDDLLDELDVVVLDPDGGEGIVGLEGQAVLGRLLGSEVFKPVVKNVGCDLLAQVVGRVFPIGGFCLGYTHEFQRILWIIHNLSTIVSIRVDKHLETWKTGVWRGIFGGCQAGDNCILPHFL